MSNLIVQIDGGIGRVICSTPAIETLAKNNPDRKIIIITTHPYVFYNNPFVWKVYGLDHDYLWEDVIQTGEFINPEPYHNHLYYTQKHHLIQSFNYLINKDDSMVSPSLYLTDQELAWGTEFIDTRKKEKGKPIGILQCFGMGVTDNFLDDTHRSLSPECIERLISLFDQCIFINASHINLDYANVWQQQFTTRQLFSLVAACDFVLTIDSFISHVGACFNKKGVLLLGGTYKENVGYSHYNTIQREGYPKSYFPNRFSGFINQNKDAMNFSADEIEEIHSALSKLSDGGCDHV